MKIIADISNNYIRSICEILKKKHSIIVFNGQKSVYDIIAKTQPNLAFCQNIHNSLLSSVCDLKIPTILYGSGPFESVCECVGVCVNRSDMSQKPILVPFFGSANEYGGYYQYKYESDILFSSNYNFQTLVKLYNYIYLNSQYKIKFAGRNIVNCCSFVGTTNNTEFGSLAKSAKTVITDNIYEHISLIYNDVCSIVANEVDKHLEQCMDKKYRMSYVENEKNKYKNNTVQIVADTINEKIEEYAKNSFSN